MINLVRELRQLTFLAVAIGESVNAQKTEGEHPGIENVQCLNRGILDSANRPRIFDIL